MLREKPEEKKSDRPQIPARKPNIAIFARNDNFLQPILWGLTIDHHCNIKREMRTDNEYFNMMQIHELMEWADCAFFDFCFEPLPMASRLLTNCRIVARLHGLEVYGPQMKAIDWSRIHLVCSPPQHSRFKREVASWLTANNLAGPLSTTIINIGVDVAPTRKPKEVFGRNIGIIAFTPLPRKRIYTTIESFYDLLRQSKEKWILHIRGGATTGYRDQEVYEYLKFITEFRTTINELGLPAESVVFHEYLDREKFQAFLANMDVIISNSTQEGYHQSIFQAMSYGAYPLVHRWLGAETLFDQEFLFLTQRELVDKIFEWDKMTLYQKQMKSLQVQKLVRQKHDEEKCAKQIVDVILGEK